MNFNDWLMSKDILGVGHGTLMNYEENSHLRIHACY